ncbi:MAG: hypothetical protein ACREMY_00330 [bacterium]
MLKKTRDQIGTAGLVVAIIALIAALTGGALAATGGGPLASTSAQRQFKKGKSKLTKQQIKEVEKLAKKYAGKDGGPGPPGPKGDAGATGVGKEGSAGKEGKEGKEGEEGASVLATQVAIGDETACSKLGGAKYEVEGSDVSTEVCNGKEGSPWTAGGTLPPGAVEEGTWAFDRSVEKFTTEVGGVVQEVTVGDSEKIRVPISFPIPLAGALDSTKVHYSSEATFATFCLVTASSPTVVNNGELCVYEQPEAQEPVKGTTFDGIYKPGSKFTANTKGALAFGAVLRFNLPTENAHGAGSFAVKGN